MTASTMRTATHCPYCALQCAMWLEPAAEVPVRVTGRDFPTNRGGLCQKGWTSASLLRHQDRLTSPLVRDERGRLQPASWEEALDHVAARVQQIQTEHGREAVAMFGSGALTNEKAYTLGKFARAVLCTPNIDYNGRFCMSSAAAAAGRAFGLDRGLPFPLSDLAGADAVLLLGSNLAETMPPSVAHLAGVRERGGLVVLDPRRSSTAALTGDPGPGWGSQGVHLQAVPGTDLVVLLALTHVVLSEGLADHDYLEQRSTGLEAVRRLAASWWPERAEAVCGVSAGMLRRVAYRLAAAAPCHGGAGAYLLTGRGVEQSTQGTATVTATINLALILGLPGRRGSGYGAITGQGNGQGGREHGQKADQLPGARSISDPRARAHVAGVWGVPEQSIPGPGRPAMELLDALGRSQPATGGPGPRALFVHGANLVVSAPNAGRVEAALEALDLLVVADFLPSETARRAHVVLPVTQWAEEEGTMTSVEGRVIRRRQALGPPGLARSELWIFAELAARLGSDVPFPTEPSAVFDELARASAGGTADYSGLSHARLDADQEAGGPGLYWPVPGPDHPGTPRPFLDRFATPDGLARMVAVDHAGVAEEVTAQTPVYLVTGRVLAHYQSGTQTRRVPELRAAAGEPFVQIHPLLAERNGIEDGALLRLTTTRGAVLARARWSSDIRTDTVFMPFHFAGAGSVNRITSDATDPVSGMPQFKVCPVALEAIGAGHD